jgi:hypothetical protein
MSMRWECSECGAWVERSRRPSRCRSCQAPGVAFVAADPEDGGDADAVESLYESWVRHGMRTSRHWRSHAA